MLPGLGSIAIAIFPLLASPSPLGLTIETRSPDAHCPDLAMTRQAAEARLGMLKVEGGQNWKAVYTIVYAPDNGGSYVHLELFDSKGARKLERDLPLAGESCATMTQALVLVLERYFRSFGAMEEEAPPTPPPSETKEKRPLASERDRAAAPPDASASRAGAIAIGGGFMTPPAAGALTASARLWLSRSFQLGLGVGWSPATVDESVGPPGGLARLRSLPMRASFTWGADVGPSFLFIGPEWLASLDRASVTGIAQPGDTSRFVFGFGVSAGALVWLRDPVALSFEAAVDATLPMATSQLIVSDQEVLRQRWVQAMLSVGLAFVISR